MSRFEWAWSLMLVLADMGDRRAIDSTNLAAFGLGLDDRGRPVCRIDATAALAGFRPSAPTTHVTGGSGGAVPPRRLPWLPRDDRNEIGPTAETSRDGDAVRRSSKIVWPLAVEGVDATNDRLGSPDDLVARDPSMTDRSAKTVAEVASTRFTDKIRRFLRLDGGRRIGDFGTDSLVERIVGAGPAGFWFRRPFGNDRTRHGLSPTANSLTVVQRHSLDHLASLDWAKHPEAFDILAANLDHEIEAMRFESLSLIESGAARAGLIGPNGPTRTTMSAKNETRPVSAVRSRSIDDDSFDDRERIAGRLRAMLMQLNDDGSLKESSTRIRAKALDLLVATTDPDSAPTVKTFDRATESSLKSPLTKPSGSVAVGADLKVEIVNRSSSTERVDLPSQKGRNDDESRPPKLLPTLRLRSAKPQHRSTRPAERSSAMEGRRGAYDR